MLYKNAFHLPTKVLNIRQVVLDHHFPVCGLSVKAPGLGGAQIPGADKGALEAVQTAPGGCDIAAALTSLGEQLPGRDGKARQVQKKQILEIEPDPGPLAAVVPAPGTGDPAKPVQGGKDGSVGRRKLHSQIPGSIQPPAGPGNDLLQAEISLLPLLGIRPGDSCKAGFHREVLGI
jgi:hypothetical protein